MKLKHDFNSLERCISLLILLSFSFACIFQGRVEEQGSHGWFNSHSALRVEQGRRPCGVEKRGQGTQTKRKVQDETGGYGCRAADPRSGGGRYGRIHLCVWRSEDFSCLDSPR